MEEICEKNSNLVQELSNVVSPVSASHLGVQQHATVSAMNTPTPTALRQGYHTSCCNQDLCSICLSPFAQPCAIIAIDFDGEDTSEDTIEIDSTRAKSALAPPTPVTGNEKGLRIITKCLHVFHESCLMEAKARKAECPNCRAALTPIAPSVRVEESPALIRQSIVSNASRVRHNMQLAMQRRQLNVEPQQE